MLESYREPPMKDVYAVLLEKEQAVERVRREIVALFVAIPLLEDAPSVPESLPPQDATFAGTRDSQDHLDDLNLYYPFARRVLEGA
jgi:hypothetical protein